MTGERSDRDLGSALDAWMNDVAPVAVPVPVLEQAFARTMSSRQVRVYPWQRLNRGRSRSRAAFALVATAALLVAVLAFGSLGGGSGIAPAPTQTPSATPHPSTSPSSSPSPPALVPVSIQPTASVGVSQPRGSRRMGRRSGSYPAVVSCGGSTRRPMRSALPSRPDQRTISTRASRQPGTESG